MADESVNYAGFVLNPNKPEGEEFVCSAIFTI